MIAHAPSGTSPSSKVEGMKIRRVFSEMATAFDHDAPLLLVGETGVGKTFLSQLLHQQTATETACFLSLNCGTLTNEQIDQQLFSRINSPVDKPDKSRIAPGSRADLPTIFIQEIETLSWKHQLKLLNLIDFQDPLKTCNDADNSPRFRMIVNCQKDLQMIVKQGDFRADLYYHLNAHCFEIPPLRDRLDEITGLTRNFVRHYSQQYSRRIDRIEDSLIRRLMDHAWPGNVRELKHVIARAVMYCDSRVLNESHLPESVLPTEASRLPVEKPRMTPMLGNNYDLTDGLSLETQLANMERQLIQQSLVQNQQNRTDAARELGVSRVTLYNKMKKLGLETQKSMV
ncbi:MAG: sigma-54-dependent Fis family transcriptional regulator [Planctomycetaceae bacterium]|nr:sigma-54-dependent Fis family transcriptional regulator [Planctomycetaceae bacterium]